MAFSFDDSPLAFDCPKCGKKIQRTVGWFKADDRSCPFCGTRFETEQFRREIDKAAKLIDDTLRKIGDIKVEIKL